MTSPPPHSSSQSQSSSAVVTRWLDLTTAANPNDAPPISPGNEFPLRTLTSLPSDSSLSERSSDSGDEGAVGGFARGNVKATLLGKGNGKNVAGQLHPLASPPATRHTPKASSRAAIMDRETAGGHARRRSSSLAGVSSVPGRHGSINHKGARKQRRRRSDHIAEEGEELLDSSSAENDEDDESRSDSTDFELDALSGEEGEGEADEETGLTRKERRRRRRRMRGLVGPGGEREGYSAEEKRVADRWLVREMLVNGVLIGLWYLFSISISVYNKWMFKEEKGDGETKNIFPFPLFTTCLHMVVQFTLASLVLFLFPAFRPRHDALNPHAAGQRVESLDPKKPLMTKWFYFSRIGPCGAATGMDIGLGNTSLKFISLTFFTMCKSSALGFVLLFAFLFRLEQPSWRLVFIILIMTIGVVMMVAGEAAFHALGFLLVMASACSSGFRWSLTQILLLRNPATANPFSSIFFLAPVMFISLFVLAIPVEGFTALSGGLAHLFAAKGTALGIGILLFPGILAFLMTSSEFALLKRTSVVTLSICGIFKEVVTITTANLVFKDPLTPINLTGLVVTIASIAAYNWMKVRKMRDEARMSAHLRGQDEYTAVRTEDVDVERDGGMVGQGQREGVVGGTVGRTSLSLAPGVSAPQRTDSPAKASPVKRPEDLE